jgi:heterotetrameric sarcosine oxidase gamma subunit
MEQTMSTSAGATALSTPPARLTAVYHKHIALGARLESRYSWLVPVVYPVAPGRAAEAVKRGVGLIDIGDAGKIDVKCSNLDALLATVFAPQTPLAVNATVVVNDALRVCRLTREQALLLTSPATFQETFDRLRDIVSTIEHTHVLDLTGALCGLRLVGPNAHVLLERLTSMDLAPDRFADGALAQCGLARVHAIVLRRDAGRTLGYDLFVDRDFGAYLWDSLLEAGAPLGIAPVGRGVEEEAG